MLGPRIDWCMSELQQFSSIDHSRQDLRLETVVKSKVVACGEAKLGEGN